MAICDGPRTGDFADTATDLPGAHWAVLGVEPLAGR